MKRILLSALLLSGLMPAVAQVKKEDLATKNTKSPGAETSVTVNGKNLWIYYHAPSVRGRHIFGGAGALQPDGSVWRLGADYATVLHTDADLDLNGLAIPKGDYTLYAHGVGAVHREVAVSRGVYSARVAAQAALGRDGWFRVRLELELLFAN